MKNKIQFIILNILLGIPILGVASGTPAECTSYFTWEQPAGSNTTIAFHNESSGDFNTWMWDFGDGTSSGVFNPEHEYGGFGTYVVCLTVSDGINCTDIYCDTVEVVPICNAEFDFTFVPTTPIHVQFTDLSTGNPNSWSWDFGDGNTSFEQNPVHPYPIPGTYDVCLIIQHEDQQNYCTDTICKTVLIPDSIACEAVFTYDINPDYPLEVNFWDHSIGNITNWEWNFGDGTNSYEQNPVHFFPKPGEYLVCLNVYHTDSLETCFHFICKTLEIPDTMNCQADFLAIADSSSSNKYQFTFLDQSTGYPDEWLWDFGDGNISQEQHPIHIYDEPGQYEVCLSSWNSEFPGCNDIQCLLVQTPNYFKLGGQAFIGSNPINNPIHTGDTGVAILYRQQANLRLVAVDTNVFYEHGYYWFNDMMELPYLLKVCLTKGSENYEQVIPSYYPSNMRWQEASAIPLGEDIFDANITLINIMGVEPGIAGINGRLIKDSRRDIANNSNYSEVPVILTDNLSQALAWTQTNEQGQFSFENIAYGSYMIYADVAGVYSLPEEIILDENFPVGDSVFISMYDSAPIYIGEPDKETINLLSLYPNPAGNSIHLDITSEETESVEIRIYNQLGQNVLSRAIRIHKGVSKLEINISNLPESIYYLRLQANTSKPLMKTFIKVD